MKTRLTAGALQCAATVIWRYGLPVLSVAVALAVAKWLQVHYNFEPFVLFLCAMMVSAWYGGLKPGLLALVLSILVFHVYFLVPIYPLEVGQEIPRLLIASLTSFFVVWLSAAQRSATESLKRSREELNGYVQELSRANASLQAENAERKRAEALLEGQKQVLEMMAGGAPLSDSLAALTVLIEGRVPGMLGSILLLDPRAARLRHGAAPSLPREFVAAIDGVAIGPQAGSCGTAAYRKEPVFVEDIATDPLWKDYRAVTLPHGLRACWSTPIFKSQRQVLGTFAMYYRQPGLPKPEHLRLIEMAAHIAAIAISAHGAQAALRESEAKLKEAQRLAKIGYWERDLVADRITWSEETARLWGLESPDPELNQAKMLEMIHPDDRKLQSQALAELQQQGRPYNVEYRIVRPDGQIRFLHVWDEIERDASGGSFGLFGTVQDITERKQTELLLHAQAQEIRAIVENSPDLIVRFDRQLRRTFVNTAFIKASGLPKEQLLGREIASAAKDGAVKATAEEMATLEEALKRAFDTARPLDFESTWPLTTGRRTFAVHLEPEFDAGGVLTSILAISRDITERIEAEKELRLSRGRLRALTARLESSREEEATRIARDIHDDLGQKLTGLKMDLLRAERKLEELGCLPAANSILDSIVSATELTDRITTGIQEIAANIRPEMLDKLGLGAALHYESRRFQERTGILCETHLPENGPTVPMEVSSGLFRIFQECLTNIARHAHASKIEAALKLEDGWVTLEVGDNGRGITEAEMASPQSLGLLGMKERTERLGGEIVIRRAREGGTNVSVRIPQIQTRAPTNDFVGSTAGQIY